MHSAKQNSSVIETVGLTKIFRDFWMRPRVVAVDQLDLMVEGPQVYGLLGPNGSGKSTTIKMLLGLLKPTRGHIAILGQRPDQMAVKQRIGYLPEESYLYRFLNARETLDYYGRLFNLDRRTRQQRIDMLLEMVGLTAVQRRPIGEYSKGMQRRIGLAQALINDPDLLILDEPTTGMDPIGTRQIKDLILQLRQRGKTVLLCSHLLADVEDVCDRVSILYGGQIRRQGTVDELLTRSDSMVVEMDQVNDQTMTKIDQLIAMDQGASIHRVDRPRQKLEDLFIDIVHEAQRDQVVTSGARAGGAMAPFLSGSTTTEGDALIDQLVAEPSQADHIASISTDALANQKEGETVATKTEVIEALIESEPANSFDDVDQAPNASPATSAPIKQSPTVDQAVIDDLLDGKGGS